MTTSPLLVVDQGTSSTKALLVDVVTGDVIVEAHCPVRISHPAPGWVEQDADQIWASVVSACQEALAGGAGVRPSLVAISNQRESVVAWSATTGRPLGPVLGWQDARTSATCAALLGGPAEELVRARTGLSLDPMFSASKMRWLLDHAVAAGAAQADVRLGTVDAWLVWNLTGGAVFATEAGNASRTLLLDLGTVAWSGDLLDVFGVPSSTLPEIRASDATFGTTAASSGLPTGVPVAGVMADSHAALFHHGCTARGSGKATYGTGSSVMTPAPVSPGAPAGIVTTLGWLTAAGGPVYAREGNVIATGSALDWVARTLGCPPHQAGGAYLDELAASAAGSAGVYFVPAFSGLGAPYWDRAATAVLTGMTGGTSPGELAHAAIEAVAHQVVDVIDAIEADGQAALTELHVDGGATAGALLMQRQADLLGRPITVAHDPSASALGAARMAATGAGLSTAWTTGTPDRVRPGRVVAPGAGAHRRSADRAGWRAAVARSRGLRSGPGDDASP